VSVIGASRRSAQRSIHSFYLTRERPLLQELLLRIYADCDIARTATALRESRIASAQAKGKGDDRSFTSDHQG
jgi:hypothetical protein